MPQNSPTPDNDSGGKTLFWIIAVALFLTLLIMVGLWGCNSWKARTHSQAQISVHSSLDHAMRSA